MLFAMLPNCVAERKYVFIGDISSVNVQKMHAVHFWQGRKADRFLSFSAEVENKWNFTSIL
jgi:hypothetical protein